MLPVYEKKKKRKKEKEEKVEKISFPLHFIHLTFSSAINISTVIKGNRVNRGISSFYNASKGEHRRILVSSMRYFIGQVTGRRN